MGLSYSFHISSKKNAIVNLNKLSQVDKHNNRKYKNENLDKSLNILLAGSNNIVNDVKKIYDKEFSESLEKYNAKQIRENRKINDYLKHINNSNNDLAVEIIIQVGDKEFWEDKNILEKQKMTVIFQKQLNQLKILESNFKIANATIHYDESSPHMHIIGIPVREKCKKGLEKQVSKRTIFNKKSLEFLQEKMRNGVEEQMKEIYGYDIVLESIKKGRNHDFMKEEYINIKKEQIALKNENKAILEQIAKNEKFLEDLTNRDKWIGLESLKKIDSRKVLKHKSLFDSRNVVQLEQEDYKKILNMAKDNAAKIEHFKNLFEQYEKENLELKKIQNELLEKIKQRVKKLEKEREKNENLSLENRKLMEYKKIADCYSEEFGKLQEKYIEENGNEIDKLFNKILKNPDFADEFMKNNIDLDLESKNKIDFRHQEKEEELER